MVPISALYMNDTKDQSQHWPKMPCGMGRFPGISWPVLKSSNHLILDGQGNKLATIIQSNLVPEQRVTTKAVLTV